MLALLETWSQQPPNVGSFPLGTELPAGWGPAAADVQAAAFPTPFARAEAMRRVLSAVDSPTDSTAGHSYFRLFKLLVVGVVLGELKIEIFDLERASEFDNFGAALRKAEPGVRYLAHLYREVDGKRISYGYSHPRAMFWPHARRTEAEWNQLAALITPGEGEALRLLADFRQALMAGSRWDAEKPVEWQRALGWLTKAVDPSDGLSLLHDHSRLVGPIGLSLTTPTGPSDSTPVFLPTRATGFGERFVGWCRSTPREVDAVSGRAIELADARGTALAEIALPRPDSGASLLDLGGGIVADRNATTVVPRSVPCFDDEEGVSGLPRALDALGLALAQAGRALDGDRIDACPVLYPDPIRILARRKLWRGAGSSLRFTTRCEREALAVGGPGRLPDPADTAADAGSFATVRFGSGTSMLFAETFAGRDIGDLRALGAALFLAFAGDAGAEGGILRDADGRVLLRATATRPLEPDEVAYALTPTGPAGTSNFARRLATLQRFVASYSVVASTADPGSLAVALHSAARTFARWANGGTDIVGMGRLGTPVVVVTVGGAPHSLLRDSLA